MSAALVISDCDNVATALEPLEPGATLCVADAAVTIVDPIPRGHKVAIRSIPAGEAVLKYGSPIGRAVVAIPPGTHVHTHNVASGRGRGDLVARSAGAGSDPDGPRIAEPPDSDSAPADADS
jgi:SAF domain